MRYIILLLISLTASSLFAGPIFPSRAIILAPRFRDLTIDTSKDARFLHQQGIWGNLAKGFSSNGDRYGWSVATGGILQFVEWPNCSIFMQGDIEVLADTHNDISFNPRAIFWTEGVVFQYKLSDIELQGGYIHRCKHDIDNLDTNEIGMHERRTLIYGSAMLRGIMRDVSLFGMQGSFWAQLDQYLIKQDTRFPDTSRPRNTDIEKLNTSLSFGGKLNIFSLGDVNIYARIVQTFAAYDGFRTLTHDGREEFGLEIKGDALEMNIFYGTENFQDDLNRPLPVNSNYSYIGIRFIGRNIGL